MGLETEYAIRFTGSGPHPGNDRIYDAFVEALAEHVTLLPGDSAPTKRQIFLENGGAFYYEHLPHAWDGGLLEGATPECTSAAQVLLYQRAQEDLLLEAVPRVEEILRRWGFPGEVGLIKNCRDAEGHIYGAQENYEADIARGPALWLYRLGLALLFPLVLGQTVVSWLIQILLAVFLVGATFAALGLLVFLPSWRGLRFMAALAEADERALNAFLGPFQLYLVYVLTWPMTAPFALLLRLTAFRPFRRCALAFLISRSVLTGAGMVEEGGRFLLAEKAPAVRRILRSSIRPEDRPIFDIGNLMKLIAMPMTLRFRPLLTLFHRRQRLQLGYGDSNAAQVAEFLKFGTTALVLDMIEAGFLADAPRLRAPKKALQTLLRDPSLQARLPLRGGDAATALELQRYYLGKAEEFLRRKGAVSMEDRRLMRLWQEAVEALEEGRPEDLVGSLDWVTKRLFLESTARKIPHGEAASQVVSLRYHELGEGYFARLERQGLAPVLVDEAQRREARRRPPRDSPAFLRGAMIRDSVNLPFPLRISWESAHIGGPFHGRLIPFRRRPPSS